MPGRREGILQLSQSSARSICTGRDETFVRDGELRGRESRRENGREETRVARSVSTGGEEEKSSFRSRTFREGKDR